MTDLNTAKINSLTQDVQRLRVRLDGLTERLKALEDAENHRQQDEDAERAYESDLTNTLHHNPPQWIDPEEINYLPDALTDNRELWEMVATCTPGACISAHYSSLTLRVVADWLQRRIEQAHANGWNYEPWQMLSDLRLAANTADAAIEAGEIMPRQSPWDAP
jgi:outer membrane murein-binding lipoprotein Lpp